MAELTLAPAPLAEARVRTSSGAFPSAAGRRRYFVWLGVMSLLGVAATFGILAWDNPMPLGTEGFWLIGRMRATSVAVMLLVAAAQAIATVSFQTVTNNRIITPSIMGFEALYTLIQTTVVFFLGSAGIVAIQGTGQFLLQVAAMVGFAALLYGWLLTGRNANVQLTLLVGIILGGAMGAASTFMRRLLSPSEFDLLTARLIGSVANADAAYLVPAVPLVLAAGGSLYVLSNRLNVLALGRDVAAGLGVEHLKWTMRVLLLVAVLMAVSTALVGPMTFLGFLVAMIAYQLSDTYDHRYVLPLAVVIGYAVLTVAYFVVKHVFYTQGSVGIVIEIVGGTFFLIYLLRKGRL